MQDDIFQKWAGSLVEAVRDLWLSLSLSVSGPPTRTLSRSPDSHRVGQFHSGSQSQHLLHSDQLCISMFLYLCVFGFVFFFERAQLPPCGPVPLRVTLSALVALGASDQVLRGSCVCLCVGVFVFAFECVFVLYVSQTPSRRKFHPGS